MVPHDPLVVSWQYLIIKNECAHRKTFPNSSFTARNGLSTHKANFGVGTCRKLLQMCFLCDLEAPEAGEWFHRPLLVFREQFGCQKNVPNRNSSPIERLLRRFITFFSHHSNRMFDLSSQFEGNTTKVDGNMLGLSATLFMVEKTRKMHSNALSTRPKFVL